MHSPSRSRWATSTATHIPTGGRESVLRQRRGPHARYWPPATPSATRTTSTSAVSPTRSRWAALQRRPHTPGLAIAAIADDYSGGAISVLFGNGAGSFSPQTDPPYPAGSFPASIAVGDFNADQHPDLAVADQSAGDILVLRGGNDGTFIQSSGRSRRASPNQARSWWPTSTAANPDPGGRRARHPPAIRPECWCCWAAPTPPSPRRGRRRPRPGASRGGRLRQ